VLAQAQHAGDRHAAGHAGLEYAGMCSVHEDAGVSNAELASAPGWPAEKACSPAPAVAAAVCTQALATR